MLLFSKKETEGKANIQNFHFVCPRRVILLWMKMWLLKGMCHITDDLLVPINLLYTKSHIKF